ncbi:hypothetical protein WJX75_001517 [Coccomyxa subellipsoidea]|uniref:PTC1-like winged helix-turn-helix domain-containing protein n=1 Tax=Coccomyxa subellipsoidea TaxID=248742 RepID=A0ABR2YHB2_9CHLO
MSAKEFQNAGVSSEAEAAAGMAQLAASGGTSRAASLSPRNNGATHVGSPMQSLGAALIALSRTIPIEMMHKGWLLERSTWEDKCRAARSVYGIADAMVHLEDWINLDYPENSEMVDVDSWSMHVRSITGHAELQVAVREFERNVERAVQMEQRPHQTPVKSERLRRKASGSLATEVTQSTTSVTSTQPSESKREGKKDLHYGRWSRERYDGAVAALVHILRAMSATSSDRCVLRPALREEARKAVGDTGLLDHLLKHLADKTVTTAGDKLRRRHNSEGHMEYWLQSAASAHIEEEELQQDAAALAGEFREVRKLRRLLAAARQEAQEALADTKPSQPTADTGAACSQCWRLQQQLSTLQAQVAELQSANNAEFEEVRQEGSGFIQLLASHVREAASLADGASRRVSSVEQETAANVEEMRGRFEALATTHSELPQLRRDVDNCTKAIQQLQHEVATLRKGLLLEPTVMDAASGPLHHPETMQTLSAEAAAMQKQWLEMNATEGNSAATLPQMIGPEA